MDLHNERDAVAAIKAIAEAFKEQNRQTAEWMATETKRHEEEQARWQAWRTEDLERLERREQQMLARYEADIHHIFADWKEQRKGEDYADNREA